MILSCLIMSYHSWLEKKKTWCLLNTLSVGFGVVIIISQNIGRAWSAATELCPGGKSFYHFDAFCPCRGPYHTATITKIAILSLCDTISQARKVKMRHCKRQKSSSWCGQCREGSDAIRMVRKTAGRLCFRDNLCQFSIFQPCFQPRIPTKQLDLVYTPLLNGPFNKFCDQESDILHIIRDP